MAELRTSTHEVSLPRLQDDEASLLLQAALAILSASSTGDERVHYHTAYGEGLRGLVEFDINWEGTVDALRRKVQHTQPVSRQYPSKDDDSHLRQSGPFDSVLLVQSISTAQEEELESYSLRVCWQIQESLLDIILVFDRLAQDEIQIERIGRQLGSLVARMTEIDPGSTLLLELPMASQQDLDEIWSWNSAVPEPCRMAIPQLIQAHVKARPDALAICAWDGKLTYQQLDILSTKLASILLAKGAGARSILPLCFEKSKWMVVGVLAVIKCGAACVALDTELPEARLNLIVQQVQPCLILSSVHAQALASRLTDGRVLVVGDEIMLDPVSDTLHDLACHAIDPSSPLYISFTSGSTGIPKGAVISHSNFASAVLHVGDYLGFGPGARVFDFAPYPFDLAWSNVLHTLCGGGCLCIPTRHDCQEDLTRTIAQFQANLINITSSAIRLIDPHRTSLRTVLLGGEPPAPDVVARWAPRVRLLNTYGSAECPSKCTVTQLHEGPGPVSMGTGSIGELWVEGPVVGQGYLNNPEKTTAIFTETPTWLSAGSSTTPGRTGRLYRTGDLVQYRSDGSLTFIGRKDQMAKVRGQRVELGEVEHHLGRHLPTLPDVSVIVEVITPRDDQTSPVLVACFGTWQLESDDLKSVLSPFIEEMETELRRTLPPYMLPSHYIVLAEIPTTATGKLDRRRLRQYGSSLTREALAAHDPFRHIATPLVTRMERVLQQLLADTLNLDATKIGGTDSFYRLGGTSIAAIHLVSVARSRGLALSVSDILKTPRLCDLARCLRPCEDTTSMVAPFSLLPGAQDASSVQQSVASLCHAPVGQIEDSLPCTPLQEGLMVLTAENKNAYVARYLFTIAPGTDVERLYRAWCTVVARVPILRTRIVDLPGHGLVQAIVDEAPTWTWIEESLNAFLQHDRRFTMGLGERLSQFHVLSDAGTPANLVWTIHHALFDAWSMDLILKKVECVYHGVTPGETFPLHVLVKHTLDTDPEACRHFWTAQFAECEAEVYPPLPSPGYRPRSTQTTGEVRKTLCWKLKDYTPSTYIRAALSILISSYSHTDEALFGAVVSGRQSSVHGIENVAGPTIATVPLRIRFEKTDTVESLLQRIQQQAIDMIPFEQTGLQKIRRLGPDAARGCQFQTLLVVQPAAKESQDGNPPIMKVWDSARAAEGLTAFNSYATAIECLLQPDGVSLRAGFDHNIIEPDQAERMLDQLAHVLQRLMTAAPMSTVAEINTISEKDEADIWSWNAEVPRRLDVSTSGVMMDAFQKHQPDSSAVCAWDMNFTYQELNEHTHCLASRLPASGFRPGDTAILCFEKSKWMPVAMLASIKAGGVSVALDITQPQERLQSIGVVLTHSNMASALEHLTKGLGFTTSTRVLDFSSHAFDAFWINTLMPLYVGGCVCIPSDEERLNGLEAAINRMQATFTFLPPSLVRYLDPEKVPSLRGLYLVGECATTDLLQAWSATTNVQIAYGPAECTVMSIKTDNSMRRTNPSTVGRGIAAVPWVVSTDDPARLVPLGAVGELWIEGPLVGEGYLNDPAKSAAAFVENPAWLLNGSAGVPGRTGRLYRTGDLVRYNADGSLVFLGRKDLQAKIRGQRVELAEVELHVARSLKMVAPVSISSAVVVAKLSVASRLVRHTSQKVRSKIGKLLPSFMVPSVYVAVEELPLTATGKLDRRKLQETAAGMSQSELVVEMDDIKDLRVEALSSAESIIQEAWGEVLSLPPGKVPVNVPFMRLGGDSITAMRVSSKCRARGLAITVGAILGGQSIEQIAEAHYNSEAENEKPQGSKEQTHMFGARASSENGPYMAHLIFEVKSTNDEALSRLQALSAWQKVVAHHSILRTVIRRESTGELRQVVQTSAAMQIDDYSCRFLPSWSFRTHDDPRRLLVTFEIHHALMDGLSMVRFRQDLAAAYSNEQMQPIAAAFEDLIGPILQREQCPRALGFWTRHLEKSWVPSLLPSDPGRPMSVQTARKKSYTLPIMNSLQKRSREESTTPRSMVLAGWASAVGHQLGRQTVAFGVVAAGRHGIPEGVAGLEIEEISRTIQKEMAEAVTYEGCSLDAIQHVVTGGQPLFNSVVNYRRFDTVAQNARRSVEFKTESIRDLWAYGYFLGVEEVEDRLQVDFQWYEGRVNEACALRLLGMFIDSLGKLARQG
ncbi:acetyl-CoA synthetase-like protein [Aspergillus indologenus CBS 114.80]|uniref:Acetyl-CoA synthetase-like protein n=1 Tax=Aspergillus indologenus CBS 114.80 TaxID=1450541 RepID=A0A2V5IF26_9EURO|nr:acetyl-CoA synthetase-like protein [Aspergillus indologenus CBS 114.80]